MINRGGRNVKVGYSELAVYDKQLVTGNKNYMLNYIRDNFYKVVNQASIISEAPEQKSLGQHTGDFNNIREFLTRCNYNSEHTHNMIFQKCVIENKVKTALQNLLQTQDHLGIL